MRFPSKETVERIRKEYPVGTLVELVRMDDPQAPPVGTKKNSGVENLSERMRSMRSETVERNEYPVGARVELMDERSPSAACRHKRHRARRGRHRQHHGCLG